MKSALKKLIFKQFVDCSFASFRFPLKSGKHLLLIISWSWEMQSAENGGGKWVGRRRWGGGYVK